MNAILLSLLLVIFIASVNSSASFSTENLFLRARNKYLRLCVFKRHVAMRKQFASVANCVLIAKSSFSSAKQCLREKANRLYQSALSKYYDANALYYSISEEDRELIEQIINLHF